MERIGLLFYLFAVSVLILERKFLLAQFENVAIAKTTDMTGSLRAAMAVDGKTTQSKWYLCIETSMDQQFSWWEVDLGKNYFIHEVRIYFRTDWTRRRNGVLVYTSKSPRQINKGQQCGEQITGYKNGSNIADIVNRTCDSVGRYVTLYEDTLNKDSCDACDGGRGMDFCEIEVYACELNVKYGSNCDKMCSDRHCAVTSSSCNTQTGDCDSGRCKPGWTGNDCTTDINECNGPNSCNVNAYCSNIIGSFTCSCKSGFTGDGHTCTDTNECLTPSACDTNAGCINTVGSYTCKCRTGYSGTGQTCIDVDECELKNSCDKNAVCHNTPGSFTCTCENGFTGDGKTCTDVDECLKSDACDPNANCTNTNGSFTCTCLNGYSGDGHSCTDVDECIVKKPCDSNANCTNTVGSYVCICQHGFTGDGKTCRECELGVSYGYNCRTLCEDRKCSKMSTCNTKTGSCIGGCEAGWEGVDCTQDINECNDQGMCNKNADCTNTAGSYICACKIGFSGDGQTCTALPEKTTDTVTIVLATTTVVFFLLFVISFVIIIKLLLRKQSKTTEPAVQFSDIKNSNERAGRSEQTSRHISTYEIVNDANSGSPERSQHVYQNTTTGETNGEETNTYEQLDTNVTRDRSTYEKLNM